VPELPPPLPPGDRTVGQLVAETIRTYGHQFWRVLPLGLPLVVADQLSVRQAGTVQMLVFWAVAPLFVAADVWACRLVLGAPVGRTAVLVALLVYLPFPALRALFILPGIAWFAFIGLAVPAAMVVGRTFRDALARGRELGVAGNTLSALLHTQGDNGQRVALAASDLVLGPLLFVGGALLYLDQAARVGSAASDRRRRRDAHFHPPVDADAAGRHDAQVEP